MDRRRFNTLCTGLLAGAAAAHADERHAAVPFPETRLIHDDKRDVTLDSLEPGTAYIFGYPYQTTPCFLIRLNQSAPGNGSWPGGLGEDQSVVAFSAICSHKMTHPAKSISHISYRSDTVSFYNEKGEKQTRKDIISCCSERSVYDPSKAAKVLSGPAPAALAIITLHNDSQQRISAIASTGSSQYERFLEKFGFRLAMEYGVTDIHARSGSIATVVPAEEFSAQQVLC